MTDLTQATAAELSRLYAKGKASPVEAMEDVLVRADKINPRINAFTRIDAALKILQADDRERPAVPATKRALAGLYHKLGRAEQAMAAEYQAQQLTRQYKDKQA